MSVLREAERYQRNARQQEENLNRRFSHKFNASMQLNLYQDASHTSKMLRGGLFMARSLLGSFLFGTVVLATVTTCVLADDKPADKYTETGTVLSVVSKHGHFYQIANDSKVYLFLCTKVKGLQFGEPECKVDGKPIVTGDTIHFRIEGDWAYMPPISGEFMEEKLRILATELKVTPPLPPAPVASTAPTGNAANSATESAVVVGTGTHIKGQKGGGYWSTNRTVSAPAITTASGSTPVIATAPGTAIPVTGGAPVTVMPVGPMTGGVVTGVPVAGGPPVTAIPTGPVTGVPVGGAPAGVMVPAAPQWVHILRIQTAGKVYQLECSSKPCAVGGKEVALGDALTLRVDNKQHAYLSSNPQDAPQQEYKVLEVRAVGTAPESQKH